MTEKAKKTKKKKLITNLVIGFVFLIGLLILLYPQISRIYYRIEANEQVADFDSAKSQLDQEEIDKRMELARAFNASLNNVVEEDPYSDDKKAKGRAEYARMLEVHEKMGHIQIPTIDIDIPIYAGTAEEVLQIGAGHLEGTSLPVGGNSTHTVITAHSGLPEARLFTDLRKMKIGDKFYIHNIGEVLAYQVDSIDVIEPTDFSKLLIVPGHDYATLLTCTPLMINTHRLLIRGHRVEYVPEVEERIIAENKTSFTYRYLFYISLILILILTIVVIRLRKRKKNAEAQYKALKLKEDEDLKLSEEPSGQTIISEGMDEIVEDVVDNEKDIDNGKE